MAEYNPRYFPEPAEFKPSRWYRGKGAQEVFDAFTAYNNEIMEAKRRDAAPQAVWPCRLKIIAVFAKANHGTRGLALYAFVQPRCASVAHERRATAPCCVARSS